jgi:hypothetical protein
MKKNMDCTSLLEICFMHWRTVLKSLLMFNHAYPILLPEVVVSLMKFHDSNKCLQVHIIVIIASMNIHKRYKI